MITLEEAKVGMADKVDQAVVDEFRRNSLLLDKLIFDDAVSPGTAGSTLTYGYLKLETPAKAGFRKLNQEYQAQEAKRTKKSADLKIFGGEFSLDRVIIKTSGAVDELNFQVQEKVKASTNLFHYTAINGDSKTNVDEFDGLAKLLAGSDTEFNKGTYVKTKDTDIIVGKNYYTLSGKVYSVVAEPTKTQITNYYENTDILDIATSEAMDKNYNAVLDAIDSFVGALASKPTMFLMNSKLKTKMKGIARRAGYYSRSEDALGRSVDLWDGVPMFDMGEYSDGVSNKMCVGIEADGTTALYAVTIAPDAFHGVSLSGDNLINVALPDLKAPGVIKKGDVEMVAAVVLKNTKKAGVLRSIKVK